MFNSSFAAELTLACAWRRQRLGAPGKSQKNRGNPRARSSTWEISLHLSCRARDDLAEGHQPLETWLSNTTFSQQNRFALLPVSASCGLHTLKILQIDKWKLSGSGTACIAYRL